MADINDTSVWSQIDADNIVGLPSYPESMPVDQFNNNLRSSQGAQARLFSREHPTLRASGSVNALLLEYTVPPLATVIGDIFRFTVNTTNTGPATLDVGTGAAWPVVVHGLPLISGELLEDTTAVVAFNAASQWELLNPQNRIFGDLHSDDDILTTGNINAGTLTTTTGLTVGTDESVGGVLSVAGAADFATDVSVGDELIVTGNTQLLGDVTVTGTLSLGKDKLIIDGQPFTLLTADAFFYVSPSGDDSTGDGTSLLPWATLSHAATVIQSHTAFGTFKANILMLPGLYSVASTAFGVFAGNWEITSSTLAANDVHLEVTGAAADGIHASGDAKVLLSKITVGSTLGYACAASLGGTLTIDDIIVTASFGHFTAFDGGKIQINSNYIIAGGATTHYAAEHATLIASSSGTPITVTATGSPPFTTFASCSAGGFIRAVSGTYSFTASGNRFVVTTNAIIDSGGEDPLTYFPGSTDVAAATGGIWS